MIKKRFLFVVQGEGRGHMTQAISLQKMFTDLGYEVPCIMLGKSRSGKTPDFVKQMVTGDLLSFESPVFITDKKMKGIKVLPSVLSNIAKLPTYIKSFKTIHNAVKEYQPDMIINFYEPLTGLYNFFYNSRAPMICIAHQYIYHHPGFEFPKGKLFDKMAIKAYTALTSLGAKKKFALSFYPINDHQKNKIVGLPAILRDELFEQEVSAGNFLLCYIAVNGFMEEVIEWNKQNPEVEIHCFTDKITDTDMVQHSPTLFFHKLNNRKFLEMMASCKGLVTTAGFESVCEAMYLGKPVYMVPVQNHYEQYCNARDAFKAGAGIYGQSFNLSKFIRYVSTYRNTHTLHQQWIGSGKEKLLSEIHSLLCERETVSPKFYILEA